MITRTPLPTPGSGDEAGGALIDAHWNNPVASAGMEDLIEPKIYLASRSVRRCTLLREAGIEHEVVDADIDDGELRYTGVDAASWVIALAYLKARAGLDAIAGDGRALVIGADTVCVLDEEVLGQPADRGEAARMIERFQGRSHAVLSGVALLDARSGQREVFAVRADVTLGELDPAEVGRYLDSDEWRGKAGGYNYTDRVAAGWPLACDGDETAVVGLPMNELRRRLANHLPTAA